MQLIRQVWRENVHWVQNYDLMGIITKRMSPHAVRFDVIFRRIETHHLILIGENSVTYYKTSLKGCYKLKGGNLVVLSIFC